MKKASDILGAFMDSLQINLEKGNSSMFNSWGNIAGEDVLSHSSIKDLRNGNLIVEADHPGWIQLLQMRKKKILKNVQKKYPELDIVDIRFILKNNHNDN